MSRAHNLPLVHALVGMAWANDEAQQQTTNQRVLARLQAASNEAHECALAVERDQPLTPRQDALVAKCEKEIIN